MRHAFNLLTVYKMRMRPENIRLLFILLLRRLLNKSSNNFPPRLSSRPRRSRRRTFIFQPNKHKFTPSSSTLINKILHPTLNPLQISRIIKLIMCQTIHTRLTIRPFNLLNLRCQTNSTPPAMRPEHKMRQLMTW